jgi:hypothetical protein
MRELIILIAKLHTRLCSATASFSFSSRSSMPRILSCSCVREFSHTTKSLSLLVSSSSQTRRRSACSTASFSRFSRSIDKAPCCLLSSVQAASLCLSSKARRSNSRSLCLALSKCVLALSKSVALTTLFRF